MDSRYILNIMQKRQLGNKLPFDFICIRKNKSLWEYGNNAPVVLQNKNERLLKFLVRPHISVRTQYGVPINCKYFSQDFYVESINFFH